MTAVAPRGQPYQHPAPSSAIVSEATVGGADLDLDACYDICRRLNAAHGRTYYYASRFLPRERRHHVHALYGFARYADDLVDHMALSWTPAQRRAALEGWSQMFSRALDAGTATDPVQRAVINTVRELHIERADLEAFLASMAMDLTVTRYRTYDDLAGYMYGSAAVIGTMMLPVLGATDPRARRPAMDLGVAFQLTNFLRDVAEDWDRGRIYLPLEDLDAFGVSETDFTARRVSTGLRRLLAFEAARTRQLYARAEDGWALLPPASRRCIRIAHHLYAGILSALEQGDYEVFARRARVPRRRKVWITLRELIA